MKKVKRGSQVLGKYGGNFWCKNEVPFKLQLKAIKAYDIDIETSTEFMDGAWNKLDNYEKIKKHLARANKRERKGREALQTDTKRKREPEVVFVRNNTRPKRGGATDECYDKRVLSDK